MVIRIIGTENITDPRGGGGSVRELGRAAPLPARAQMLAFLTHMRTHTGTRGRRPSFQHLYVHLLWLYFLTL